MTKHIGINVASEVVETRIPIRIAHQVRGISFSYWPSSEVIDIRYC